MSAHASPLLAQAIAPDQGSLSAAQISEVVAGCLPVEAYRGRKVLLIIPDGTRTAPVGTLFKAVHSRIGHVAGSIDIMIALGTHQPMSEEAICNRLEISMEQRRSTYAAVRFYNHEWDNPQALQVVGTLTAEDVEKISGGRFSMEVPVEINKRVFEYDELLIIGPVFPHEVVGFS
ncbi:MAG: DUF2088 domain-containing protein, partial [Verrucomicrobia bacterium]|nr:DUF2088 domain-containing protein [Verrucomicrobiota bacterium]